MPSRTVYVDQDGPYIRLGKRKYRPPAGVTVAQRTVVQTWDRSSPRHNTVSVWNNSGAKAAWASWTTTDPYVAPTVRAAPRKPVKPGENQVEVRKFNTFAIVAETRAKHNGRKLGKPMYLHSHGIEMDRAEWESFRDEIDRAWDEVPTLGIVAKLKAELAAEDELDEYLKGKGLK